MANCEFCRDNTTGNILIYGKGSISICGKKKCKDQALLAYTK